MTAIRLGVVGAGANARARHIPAFRTLSGVVVTGVANRSIESTRRSATELGIPRPFDSWQDLVASADIDAVLIGTYPDMHERVATAALEHGKHVLVEARIARSADEARRMLVAAEQRPGLVAQVVPSPLAFEVDPYVRHLISSGAIGAVLVVNVVVNGSNFIDHDSPLHWRQDGEKVGSNVLELGIVYEAITRWIGPATRVYADGPVNVPVRVHPETGEPTQIGVPDHLDVTFEFGSGGRGHIQMSSVTGYAPEPSIWIFGTEGTVAIDLKSRSVRVGTRIRGMEDVRIPGHLRSERRTAHEFIQAIRGSGEVTRTAFAEGVEYMEFVDAAEASRTRGASMEVPSRHAAK